MPRLTPKEAQGLMNAYAAVYAKKEEPTEEPKVRILLLLKNLQKINN